MDILVPMLMTFIVIQLGMGVASIVNSKLDDTFRPLIVISALIIIILEILAGWQWWLICLMGVVAIINMIPILLENSDNYRPVTEPAERIVYIYRDREPEVKKDLEEVHCLNCGGLNVVNRKQWKCPYCGSNPLVRNK